ncbi:MAG: HlyC/CorC family transporter [Lentisphaeria bacterium]|nr:HlyC/CorC family transporter [Lentisphaeria bacterium]
MESGLLPNIGILVFLLAMSAYFSASETAFSSVNRTRLKTLIEKGSRSAKLALKLSDEYDRLISTILIGNNIVNIAMASLGTMLFVKYYGDELGTTLSTVVITIAVLIFGEISPKSIAKDCAESFAIFSAPFLQFLIWILTPVCFVFSAWKKILSKLLKLDNDSRISQAELLMFVEEVQQDGSINKNDGELLRNAIEFSDVEVKDILTPRVKLEALPSNCSKEDVARLFQETKFSRLLIYDGTIDHIVGVIHHKMFYVGAGITEKPLKDIIRPVLFVFQNEKISSLIKKLQQKQVQVAVVLDEYAGTCGIVTMEDILEELVGDIWDEHDDVEEFFKKVSENLYHVNAAVHLSDFCDFFGVKIDSDMVSLNGWVLEHFHSIPKAGDSFEYEDLKITVLASEHRRIALLEVERESQEEPNTQQEGVSS